MKLEVCRELPCLLKCGSGTILLHVDDLLFHGTEDWVTRGIDPTPRVDFQIQLHVCIKAGRWKLRVFERVACDSPKL